MRNLLPGALNCDFFCPQTESSDFGSRLRPFSAGQGYPDSTADSSKKCRLTYVYSHFNRIFYSIA